jgi:hypothetical protein
MSNFDFEYLGSKRKKASSQAIRKEEEFRFKKKQYCNGLYLYNAKKISRSRPKILGLIKILSSITSNLMILSDLVASFT